MTISMILSLVSIVLSVAVIVLNIKTMKSYERIKRKIPHKLYLQLKTKGLYRARLVLYASYPFMAIGWLDPEKVVEKAMSFVKIDTKFMG